MRVLHLPLLLVETPIQHQKLIVKFIKLILSFLNFSYDSFSFTSQTISTCFGIQPWLLLQSLVFEVITAVYIITLLRIQFVNIDGGFIHFYYLRVEIWSVELGFTVGVWINESCFTTGMMRTAQCLRVL